jgi:hypothetical protein
MDFTSELPQPRDDEPESLRDDIRDELADHLQCSLHKELLAGSNETEAHENALARFGNPAQIARRLWFDAMKGKIMLQKVTFGMSLVALLLCSALLWLVFQGMRQNQETAAAMLAKLNDLSASNANRDLISFKVRLSDEDNRPVAGISATAAGAFYNEREIDVHRESDAQGVIDFGKVHPSRCLLTLTSKQGFTYMEHLSVSPGSESAFYICPQKLPPLRMVKPKLEVPLDMQNNDDHVYFVPMHVETRLRTNGGSNWFVRKRVECFFDQHGQLLGNITSDLDSSAVTFTGKLPDQLERKSFLTLLDRTLVTLDGIWSFSTSDYSKNVSHRDGDTFYSGELGTREFEQREWTVAASGDNNPTVKMEISILPKEFWNGMRAINNRAVKDEPPWVRTSNE